MELTANNVESLVEDCLGDKTGSIKVTGVKITAYFNARKLEEHKDDIKDMLRQLPAQFHVGSGGGWSFLNMCIRKDGRQWADAHITMDKLVCLGLATGQVEFLMQREWWKVFPGGMPYIRIYLIC